MKQDELDKAAAHLDEVYKNVTEDAKISSKMVLADVSAWRSATDSWVKEHNEIVKGAPSAAKQDEYEARRRNYAPAK